MFIIATSSWFSCWIHGDSKIPLQLKSSIASLIFQNSILKIILVSEKVKRNEHPREGSMAQNLVAPKKRTRTLASSQAHIPDYNEISPLFCVCIYLCVCLASHSLFRIKQMVSTSALPFPFQLNYAYAMHIYIIIPFDQKQSCAGSGKLNQALLESDFGEVRPELGAGDSVSMKQLVTVKFKEQIFSSWCMAA